MPVQLQCTSVVIRNDALEKVLEGGAGNFSSIALNNMSYSDGMLSQASFMSNIDAEGFCKSLELRGLQRESENPDFVVVFQHDQSINPPCDWLVLFERESRLIGTLRGSTSRKVIAPSEPLDESIVHYTEDEIAEKFVFVTREDNVDTYRNKETGVLVYHARRTESDDELFKAAFKTVWEFRREAGDSIRTGKDAEKVKDAIEKLQGIAARNPDTAKIWLWLGMGWYSVGNVANGIRTLRKAVDLDPEETMYLKEFAGVLLAEGQFEEALEISNRAVVLCPDSPELLGNQGVIELLCGQAERAKVTIEKALEFDPRDEINILMKKVVNDVLSGASPQPKSLLELIQKPSKPTKKSFWSRWLGK